MNIGLVKVMSQVLTSALISCLTAKVTIYFIYRRRFRREPSQETSDAFQAVRAIMAGIITDNVIPTVLVIVLRILIESVPS